MEQLKSRSSRVPGIRSICLSIASILLMCGPALGQDPQHTTTTGTVVSYTQKTMVMKTENNQFRLFVFDEHTVKPPTLAAGAGVRVISAQTEDPEARLAVLVTAAEATPSTAGPTAAQPDVVPRSVREAESAIQRDARKFHLGFQGGVALNPELVDIGVHAKFGPFFTKNVQFRPSIDFSFGEITKLFALNADFLYSLSPSPGARRSLYFGVGPQFNFAERSASGEGVSFSDFHYSNALSIIMGVRWRSGVFTEMKTSIWASPAPIFRLMAGYSF